MEIVKTSFIEGAKKAKGTVVLIDVFRAFTTSAYVMGNNAAKIIPVGKVEEAFALKKKHPDYILMGERKGIIIPGFDYGNSPSNVKNVDFTGKIAILTTSAGTQGIINAKQADEILLGSFVTAKAIINYIKNKNPKTVTIVALGNDGIESRDEDELCAQYLKDLLEGKKTDFKKIKSHLEKYDVVLDNFFNKEKSQTPEDDFHCSMALDKFNFVLKVEKDKDGLFVRKI